VPLRGAREIPTARLVSGFTLIEMLVVLAIITVLMAIVFSSQSSFNKSLVLSNTAYDVALTLRNAQAFGLGNRVTVGNIKNAGYGIHLVKGTQTSFTLFADLDIPDIDNCHGLPLSRDINAPDAQYGNCVYTFSADGPAVQTYNLNNGVTISDFCARDAMFGILVCANNGSINMNSLDIVFARPNPDVFIRRDSVPNTYYPDTAACIVLTQSQDTSAHRYVSVSSVGEITVNSTSCI